MAQLLAAVDPAQKAIGPAPLPLFDRYPFGPVVDGTIVPRHPFEPSAPAVSADIPLLIGDMKDEMASFLARDDKVWHRTLTEPELRDRVAAVAGEHTDRVIETYQRLYPDMNPAERLIATLTDSNFRIRSLMVAERKAVQAGAPIYMYAFEWETPVQGWAPESTACARRAVHLRHHRSDQRHRSQPGRAHAGRDDVRAPGPRSLIAACLRTPVDPALARLRPDAASDDDLGRRMPDRERSAWRNQAALAGDHGAADALTPSPAKRGE